MEKSITKEEIATLDIEDYAGRIIVVQSLEEAEKAVNYLSSFSMIGFDTETRPAFRKGSVNEVALIQLATEDTCFLFRMNKIGFPACLVGLLTDTAVQKIGLSLRDDFTSMGRRMKFTPKQFVDLQAIVPQYGISDISLQKVYALLFRKKISKSQRLTNWEAEELTESQKKYAALDAWACLKIYEELCRIKKYI